MVYIVHMPHKFTTRPFSDKKEAIKFIKWPKSTPTGQAIREWFDQFDDENVVAKPADEFHQQIKAEGFGPEAHIEEEEPNANTRTVI